VWKTKKYIMVESYKFRVMDPEIKKPETWPFLELDVYIEDESAALVEKSTLFLDYDQIEIMYFWESTLRLNNGESKSITVIRLSDDTNFKVALSYNRFKKVILEWFKYYNYLIDSGVYELTLSTEEEKESE
jgi:hypothetical protein